ncbi:hypothetical protein CDL12_21394 [Handroanthus impetiginosus]|uniref:Uncharacterized protein n=1 Tax=Handroanthus impetiginosus TaxID=429701 RepID=A0A2G9GLB1_9LAMI|nr:hypothetical protein CDL12_21394 [Handroanthus impetiginosus]
MEDDEGRVKALICGASSLAAISLSPPPLPPSLYLSRFFCRRFCFLFLVLLFIQFLFGLIIHMEENWRSENLPPLADVGCGNQLNRSNSDASTLTAENCEDVVHFSADSKPDDSAMWTDEKHSLYLELLEVSFVKQLHESMGLFAQHTKQNKRDKNISENWPIDVNYTTEQQTVVQRGCWPKINCEKRDFHSSVSADSHNTREVPWVYHSERLGVHYPPASADMSEIFMLSGAENHGKEGTGQNFVDEEIENQSSTMSRAKRLKTSLADRSSQDQMSPETYQQATGSCTLGGELAHHECVSKTSDSPVYPPT